MWRHLPLTDVHPRAQLAAEASEAAAAQGAFWPMYDLLLQHQDALTMMDLRGCAESLGLDADRFGAELERHMYETRVAQDVESADLSGVSGTPTFQVSVAFGDLWSREWVPVASGIRTPPRLRRGVVKLTTEFRRRANRCARRGGGAGRARGGGRRGGSQD